MEIQSFEINEIYEDCILSNCATNNKDTDYFCRLVWIVNARAALELKRAEKDVPLLPNNPARPSDREIRSCSWNANAITQDKNCMMKFSNNICTA